MQAIDVRKWMLLFFPNLRDQGVHYIGGADPLPKPLTPEEERALVARLPEDDGTVRVAASATVCIAPVSADPDLNILVSDSVEPERGGELTMVIQHRCPCELTVTVEDMLGRTVRRLATLQATRPEQLYPDGSAFTWNGLDDRGEAAPAGWYRVRARANVGGRSFTYASRSVELRAEREDLAIWDEVPEDVLPEEE